jgi:hypothetical protein
MRLDGAFGGGEQVGICSGQDAGLPLAQILQDNLKNSFKK